MGIINWFDKSKNIDVKVIKKINVDNVDWCDEAILFCVKNGKGTLTTRSTKSDDHNDCYYQLLFNNKPIFQGKYPYCPTCSGMLATGYGIENINSPELVKVSESLNSEFTGLENSFESIKPLLGLLDDGYYLLADTSLFPSDGNGNFFYSVPNELTYNESATEYFYDSNFMGVAKGFPTFIYPTQSAELINERRVDEYAEIISKTSNPPRGLAYYDSGFICALLDGHHKACASSMLGKRFNCLTIIPAKYFYRPGSTYPDKIEFADIQIDEKLDVGKKKIARIGERLYHSLPVYELTGRVFSDKYFNSFPTVRSIAGAKVADIDLKGDLVEQAKVCIENYSDENRYKLEYIIEYFHDTEVAFTISKMVIKNEMTPKGLVICAIKELLRHPCDETEELMVNYYLNHDPQDEGVKLVNTYWGKYSN